MQALLGNFSNKLEDVDSNDRGEEMNFHIQMNNMISDMIFNCTHSKKCYIFLISHAITK